MQRNNWKCSSSSSSKVIFGMPLSSREEPLKIATDSEANYIPSVKPGVSVSGGNIRDTWMLSAITSCCRASPKPRRANLLAE